MCKQRANDVAALGSQGGHPPVHFPCLLHMGRGRGRSRSRSRSTDRIWNRPRPLRHTSDRGTATDTYRRRDTKPDPEVRGSFHSQFGSEADPDEVPLESLSEAEQMKRLMGFGGFNSTKVLCSCSVIFLLVHIFQNFPLD